MPSAPAPTAPAAPATPAAPAAPATPAAPAPEAGRSNSLNDAFSAIDNAIKESDAKDETKRVAKNAAAAKANKQTPAPPEEGEPGQTPAEAPAKPAEAPAKPAAKDETAPLSAPQLRASYAELKKTHAAASEKLAAAEARLKELEGINERLESTSKRAEELEQQIKFVDYEKSPEYKEKFYQPFLDAYQTGRKKVEALRTVERRDDMEEITQARRSGTSDDFDSIMRIADDGEAAELADKLFGAQASVVMYHREKVMELNRARVDAIEEYKRNGGEREKETAQRAQAMQEKFRTSYKQAIDTGLTSHPEWFKPDDGDEAGAAMLEKGMKDADSVFAKSNLPPEQVALRRAAFRNMAGGFPFLALKLHRASAKIAELEKQVAEFKKSEPTGGSRKRDASEPLSAIDEIDQLDRAR